MSRQVKLVVDAEMAGAFAAFSKLVQQQDRAEKGMEKIAAAGNRAERAQTAAVNRLVQRVQTQTRSGELALSRTDRVLLRDRVAGIAGPSAPDGAMNTAIARRFLAAQLRDERAFARFAREQESARIGRSAGSLHSMNTLLGRGGAAVAAASARAEARSAAAAEGAMYAGNVAAYGAAGRMPGEDALSARARADVARAVGRSRELAGKVTPEDMENMVGRRVNQLRGRQEIRQGVSTGALAVGAAVTGFLNSQEDQLRQYAEAVTQYERQMSPLFGVGDNMGSRRQIGRDVLQQAAGLGVPFGDLAAARFGVESAASGLSPQVREAIVRGGMNFYRLQGSDMRTTTTALTAGYKILEKDLPPGPAGVKALENQLAYAADKGSFEVDQVTPYLGMVLSTFKSLGYTKEDALAGMIIGSGSGARPEQYMTAMRNLPMMMTAAEEKLGRKLPADFAGAMTAVGSLPAEEMIDLVGRDNFTAAKAIADNIAELQKHTAALQQVTGQVDVIGKKLSIAWTDPSKGAAGTIDTSNQIRDQAPLLQLQDPAMRKDLEDYALREAGAALNYGPAAKALRLDQLGKFTEHAYDKLGVVGAVEAWADKFPSWAPGNKLRQWAPDPNQNRRTGVLQAIAAAEASQDRKKAARLTLQYGRLTNSYYVNSAGEKVYTGENEVRGLESMWAEGRDWSAGRYTDYMTKRFNNSAAADAMLTPPPFSMVPPAAAGAEPRQELNAGRSLEGLRNVAPLLLEASRNHLAAASVMTGGARDANAHRE